MKVGLIANDSSARQRRMQRNHRNLKPANFGVNVPRSIYRPILSTK